MAIPIDELTKPLSQDEVEQSIYNLLTASGVNTTSWQEGGVLRTFISTMALLLSGFSTFVSTVVRGTFLDLATDIYLDLLAGFVYNVERRAATFATGEVIFQNTAGGAYFFNPGELVVRNPFTGKTYTNTSVVGISPLATNVIVAIQAQEVGSASTSAPNTITEIVTTNIGLQCTNPSPVIGSDAESDESLRQKCRDALGALSPNGPKEAYAFVAKTTPRLDGSIIEVNRVSTSANSSTGEVFVWLADPDGPLDPSDVALIDANIQEKVVPLAVTAFVENATAVPVPVVCTVYVKKSSNQSVASVQAGVVNTLTLLFESYPIGGYSLSLGGQGYVFKSEIECAVQDGNASIFNAIVTQPSGDVPLAQNEVAVLQTPLINVILV